MGKQGWRQWPSSGRNKPYRGGGWQQDSSSYWGDGSYDNYDSRQAEAQLGRSKLGESSAAVGDSCPESRSASTKASRGQGAGGSRMGPVPARPSNQVHEGSREIQGRHGQGDPSSCGERSCTDASFSGAAGGHEQPGAACRAEGGRGPGCYRPRVGIPPWGGGQRRGDDARRYRGGEAEDEGCYGGAYDPASNETYDAFDPVAGTEAIYDHTAACGNDDQQPSGLWNSGGISGCCRGPLPDLTDYANVFALTPVGENPFAVFGEADTYQGGRSPEQEVGGASEPSDGEPGGRRRGRDPGGRAGEDQGYRPRQPCGYGLEGRA